MNRLCPVCSSAKKGFLYKQNFNSKDISLMSEYNVVYCQLCGFMYADGIPSQSNFENYYQNMSKYEFNYKGSVVSQDYLDHFTKIANFIIPHLANKKVKILDIGCATGALLHVFQKCGYSNLLGIDLSQTCVNAAKKLYKLHAVTSNIAKFNSTQKFDLIILSAILEHLVDFKNFIEKIRLLLKDNGLLFVEVPDAERFETYTSSPFQQFSVEHINYFTAHSLKNLLVSFGFQTIDMCNSEVAMNMTTDPDVLILSRKTNKDSSPIIPDRIGKQKVKKYITKCSLIDLEINKALGKKLVNTRKIIVWGTGTHTLRLIGSGLLDVSNILYFVDSNQRYVGKKLEGLDIKKPEDIKENVPILISTYSYQQEITHQIKKLMKLRNRIIRLY